MALSPSQMLPSDRIPDWVERLLEAAETIGPRSGPGGDEVFGHLGSPEDLLWEFGNPLSPPKRFLLPQTEPVARIQEEEGRIRVEELHDNRPHILLNLRSCDLKGILYLTRVHAQDLPDEGFLRRAGSFTLVNLTCSRPCPQGFCVCCAAGPFLQEGFDLQLTDLGDGLLAEVGSPKGSNLLELGKDLFREPTSGELDRRVELEREALRNFGEVTCHLGSAMRRISTRRVDDSLWESMAPWCLECGGCNLVCPTCYCFSVKDRLEDCPARGEGQGHPDPGGNGNGKTPAWIRCKIWDSCQYPAFTMEASGHNPRAAKTERMKRRFYHKVSAQYYKRDTMPGCVGCGRCIRVCLGAADMPSVVGAIRRGAWEGASP